MRPDNTVIFEGFINGNAELSWTNNNKPYLRLWLTNRWKRGDYENFAEVNVTLWGKGAEKFDGMKGDRVQVIGELQTREYNNKKYTDLVATRAIVTWRKNGSDTGVTRPYKEPENSGEDDKDDDDLPF